MTFRNGNDVAVGFRRPLEGHINLARCFGCRQTPSLPHVVECGGLPVQFRFAERFVGLAAARGAGRVLRKGPRGRLRKRRLKAHRHKREAEDSGLRSVACIRCGFITQAGTLPRAAASTPIPSPARESDPGIDYRERPDRFSHLCGRARPGPEIRGQERLLAVALGQFGAWRGLDR